MIYDNGNQLFDREMPLMRHGDDTGKMNVPATAETHPNALDPSTIIRDYQTCMSTVIESS